MSDATAEARIQLLLGELKLPTVKRIHSKVAREVSLAGGDFAAFLEAILEEEVRERRTRRIQRRLKEATFPQTKLLEELDPAGLPKGISYEQLSTLATGRYIKERENIIAIGNSGTGKTHVATALGVAACKQGHRVRAYTAIDLASEMEAAQEEHQLHRFLARFAKWDLVIVDELGYLPVSKHAAELLFQAFSARHERGSVIITTNLPFEDWPQVFQTERLTVAMLDRVTHRAHILEMNGESYRLKSAKTRKRRKKTEPAAADETVTTEKSE
jgi:DNA replication protein DnaC